jgi:penicillin-binding protein 2
VQLAQALATLANNGAMYRPRLVSHIDNPRTGERQFLEPQLVRQLQLQPEHIAFIKEAMAGVNLEGTARWAFAGAQYTSGGKTGTAQVVGLKPGEKYEEEKVAERLRDHSLYIAFAPLEGPKIALAVLVENGGFGARAAAPIARTVLDYYLLGKMPKAPRRPAPEADVKSDAESD